MELCSLGLLWPLLTSVCSALPRFLVQWLLFSEHFIQTSPGTTHFFLSIHLPHLPYMILCSYWALTCYAVLPSCIAWCDFCSSDQRFAHGLVCSPHPASFRFHLTMDTLAFGYILPTTGRIPDLHRLETCAARRTYKNRAPSQRRSYKSPKAFW